MRNLFAIMIIASVVSVSAENQYAITVPATNSTVILAPMGAQKTATIWSTNTVVANGDILRVRNTTRTYMVLVAGTTGATAPTTTRQTGLITDGDAGLVYIDTGGREKAIVTQEASADVWYQIGSTCTTNGGEFAYVKGQQYSTASDGTVSVYSTGGVKLNIIDK